MIFQISVDFQEDSGNNEVSAKKQLMNWASELINNLPESGELIVVLSILASIPVSMI